MKTKNKVFTGLAAFLVLAILVICLILPWPVVYRGIKYGMPTIYSTDVFPSTEIRKSDHPFYFTEVADKPEMFAPQVAWGCCDTLDVPLNEYLKTTSTVSFLIIRNDSLLYEQYYKEFDRSRESVVFSISKSITSLLMGIAKDEGYIRSVQDPITRYIPELEKADPKFKELTLEALLNMRAGFDFDESYSFNPFSQMARLYLDHSQLDLIEELHFKYEPNTHNEYQSIVTSCLGIAVERATGKKLGEYLEEKVWQPLGMENDALWSLDDAGNSKAYGGLATTGIDLAKIGRLYLHYGNWEGRQIVDSAWVSKSITANVENNCYQYQWRNPKENPTCFVAKGMKNQYIFVDPAKNLIIIRTGESEDRNYIELIQKIAERL